jgi:nucleoside-diphosphate-sugar epimerase
MRIFLTGATGFIGSRIVPELLAAGHQVLGLTRSDTGAAALEAAGAQAHRGDLADPASLAAGAAQADAVIHTAFDHDFSNFLANCEKERVAIEAMGEVLVGTNKPIIITSGVGMGSPEGGGLAREDIFNLAHPNPRTISEVTGARLTERGVDVRIVRLPQVHDTVKQGLVTHLVAIERSQGRAAYVGDGQNRWSAAPVQDVARLYVLALDKGEAGARYHAVAEEAVTARDIAEAIGAGLKVPVVSLSPEEAPAHFGWMAMFTSLDMAASSEWTRKALGWTPTGRGLIADLQAMDYGV